MGYSEIKFELEKMTTSYMMFKSVLVATCMKTNKYKQYLCY